MAEKKSIVESVLMDAKKIQAALDANTKEILRSVTRGEIDSVVKESLISEDDFDEEDIESDATTDSPEPTGDETPEFGGGEETEIPDDNVGLEDSEEVGPEVGDQETGMDADAFGGDEVDMTSASDDDVIQIYKKLSGEDEIEIVGDEIHLTISEPGEYVVKTGAGAPSGLGGGSEDMDIETGDGEDVDIDTDGGDDYEIELGDEDGSEEAPAETPETPEAPSGTEETPDEASASEEGPDDEIEEQISTNRVAQNRVGGDLTDIKGPGAKQGANFQNESITATKKLLTEAKTKYDKLLVEVTQLKDENGQFKEALKDFRNKLKGFFELVTVCKVSICASRK